MSSILDDLEKNLRDRLANAVQDYLALCDAGSIPRDEALSCLIFNALRMVTTLTAGFTSVSPEVFGQMCASQLDRAKRRLEANDAK